MTRQVMKRKNVWIGLCLLLCAMCAPQSWAQNNVIDEVVWVVGDEPILKSDIEEARMNAQYEGRKFKRDPSCEIAEELAIQKLYLNQAKLDSIEASDNEILARLDAMTNRYIQMIGSKEKMMEYFGKTWSQIRAEMRENIRNTLVVQRMQQKIVGEIKVTPAQVRRYFEKLPKDSVPYVPTRVEVQIITNKPKVPQKEIDAVKERLRDFSDRIVKGESDFSTLALLYSEDKGSAARGGELGFSSREKFVPAFSQVAFNLRDPKKVSKIVKTEFGYHIIQLIERRGDRVNCRHILLRPEVPFDRIDESKQRLDSIADEIRAEKFTFEKAAQFLSSDEATRNNKGLLPNPRTNTSKFEMQELPQEIANVVKDMKVNEISEAFVKKSQRDGSEDVVIVKLKSRTEGHKAIITEDYQRLKAIVEEKLRAEALEKWIREKQEKTYIRINENGKKCAFKYPGWIK